MPRDGLSAPARHGHDSTRDRIEQGVARGEDDARIAREVGCTVERVRRVRREMNAAVVSKSGTPWGRGRK